MITENRKDKKHKEKSQKRIYKRNIPNRRFAHLKNGEVILTIRHRSQRDRSTRKFIHGTSSGVDFQIKHCALGEKLGADIEHFIL